MRRDIASIAARELVIGAALAAGVSAVVVAIGLTAFGVPFSQMVVIAYALVLAIIACNMFGALLPVGLKAIGLDPAFFSTPLITTISDLIALFTLFQFSRWILG